MIGFLYAFFIAKSKLMCCNGCQSLVEYKNSGYYVMVGSVVAELGVYFSI